MFRKPVFAVIAVFAAVFAAVIAVILLFSVNQCFSEFAWACSLSHS
jgi:hypothetical protein